MEVKVYLLILIMLVSYTLTPDQNRITIECSFPEELYANTSNSISITITNLENRLIHVERVGFYAAWGLLSKEVGEDILPQEKATLDVEFFIPASVESGVYALEPFIEYRLFESKKLHRYIGSYEYVYIRRIQELVKLHVDLNSSSVTSGDVILATVEVKEPAISPLRLNLTVRLDTLELIKDNVTIRSGSIVLKEYLLIIPTVKPGEHYLIFTLGFKSLTASVKRKIEVKEEKHFFDLKKASQMLMEANKSISSAEDACAIAVRDGYDKPLPINLWYAYNNYTAALAAFQKKDNSTFKYCENAILNSKKVIKDLIPFYVSLVDGEIEERENNLSYLINLQASGSKVNEIKDMINKIKKERDKAIQELNQSDFLTGRDHIMYCIDELKNVDEALDTAYRSHIKEAAISGVMWTAAFLLGLILMITGYSKILKVLKGKKGGIERS